MSYVADVIIMCLWLNLFFGLWLLRRHWAEAKMFLVAYVILTVATTCATILWVG